MTAPRQQFHSETQALHYCHATIAHDAARDIT
jgi:hypothetical protein